MFDIQEALRATVFGPPEDAADDVARYFDPRYVQITDGVESDYGQFVDHIGVVRHRVASGELTVLESAVEGRTVADRHIVTTRMHDGTEASFEVLLIGQLTDDDRLLRVVETTRQLTGDPNQAQLGRAR